MSCDKVVLSVGGGESACISLAEGEIINDPECVGFIQLGCQAIELMYLQRGLAKRLDRGCRDYYYIGKCRDNIDGLWDELTEQEQEAARNFAGFLAKGKDWEWLQFE